MTEAFEEWVRKRLSAIDTRIGEQGKKLWAAIGVLSVTVAGLTTWQATAQSTIADQGNRISALEQELHKLDPYTEEGKYALVGAFTTQKPAQRATCAAWSEVAGEGYHRCSLLGEAPVTVTQPAILLEGPEPLHVVVYAEKIGG